MQGALKPINTYRINPELGQEDRRFLERIFASKVKRFLWRPWNHMGELQYTSIHS